MNAFIVRPINGTLGSAIAIRDGFAEEQKLAIFADARIQDCTRVGDDRCLFLSHKMGIALVDLSSRKVIERGRLKQAADRIAVSRDGRWAVAYHCNPGLIAVIELPTLQESARYNLIQTREDGAFQLLHRDNDVLNESGAPWNSIPFSDGPLRGEAGADQFWLKYAPVEPNGLRRIRFDRGARATFRADGKLVAPFEFSVNGPEWVWSRLRNKPITTMARDTTVGVAVIDLDTARLEMQVIQRQIEPSVYTTFPVQSISPDGTHAIVRAFDPVDAGAREHGLGGRLRQLFGSEPDAALAFGLEVWDVTGTPRLTRSIAFKPLNGETLRRINTLRFNDAELAEARKEIGLVFPGVEAGFAGREHEWRTSREKQLEDAYFDPLETREAPAFNPAFGHVHFPVLYAEATQLFWKLRPRPFSTLPWDHFDDRQRCFVASVLNGWSAHSAYSVDSIAWIARDRFVVLSRDGTVRELSIAGDVGQTYQLVDPKTGTWSFTEPSLFPHELIHIRSSAFAITAFNHRLEFDLPSMAASSVGALGAPIPLAYRAVADVAARNAEVKRVDSLAEAIRRGYVKIGSKEPARLIAGLRELAREAREHFDEIVVDERWLPTLHYRGKAVGETEFCDILAADGSDAATRALDELLTAFLDATAVRRQNVWHPDDVTPTMGPVTFALIRLCDPLPPSVARFYDRRDMSHDTWTPQEFERLDLPKSRFSSPDLLTLQIRLAIQDICTGNVKADIFALYRLPLVREALHVDPSRSADLAQAIIDQLSGQASDLAWATSAGVAGVLEAIVEGLDAGIPAEAALADELRRRSKFASS
ncbi:hypothetical protein [Bradyrhizobium sp. Ce-3]|uniref:hypothetical protein n=1 Tax=Bradyrhizobium sp. Ce-3 TaxID=2913970 RepID=UPI001FC7EB69|nr:hypothetical protein [Bradyrhizobium sp. Ce-3]GKQ51500.1 hypothetical protein BRSPCE3_23550 [Bradyrhizobium sp. Ce-3]